MSRYFQSLDKGSQELGSLLSDCHLSNRVPSIDHQVSEAVATYARLQELSDISQSIVLTVHTWRGTTGVSLLCRRRVIQYPMASQTPSAGSSRLCIEATIALMLKSSGNGESINGLSDTPVHPRK